MDRHFRRTWAPPYCDGLSRPRRLWMTSVIHERMQHSLAPSKELRPLCGPEYAAYALKRGGSRLRHRLLSIGRDPFVNANDFSAETKLLGERFGEAAPTVQEIVDMRS